MRTASWVMALGVCAAAMSVQAAATGDGLTPVAEARAWPTWQTRISNNSDSRMASRTAAWREAGLQARSVGVLGDYYFSRSTWIPHTLGGFRATGAMFFGPRGEDGAGFWQSSRYTLTPLSARSAGLAAAPYAGVGYTAMSASRAWGFSADLGLMSLRPSQAGGIGRSSGGFGPDDSGRDVRLSPLLQVGVSYSF